MKEILDSNRRTGTVAFGISLPSRPFVHIVILFLIATAIETWQNITHASIDAKGVITIDDIGINHWMITIPFVFSMFMLESMYYRWQVIRVCSKTEYLMKRDHNYVMQEEDKIDLCKKVCIMQEDQSNFFKDLLFFIALSFTFGIIRNIISVAITYFYLKA